MLIFPDPNVETEYTDPNGSVWEFNGTGWVRQCDCPDGGGDGGDGGSGDPYWDHVKCQMQFEGGFASDVGSTAYTLVKDSDAAVTDDRAKHGLFSMYCDGQESGITTRFTGGVFFNSAWTVEAWFHPQGNPNNKSWLVGMDDGKSNREGFRLLREDYKLVLLVREPSNNTNFINETTSLEMTSNGWSHIAISYDGARFRVFIDGVRALDKIYTGKAFTHAHLKLGGRHRADWLTNNNVEAQGWFDDFRVTGACRYTGDFEPPGELPQSAFAYFDKEVVEIDQKDSNDADLSELTTNVTTEE